MDTIGFVGFGEVASRFAAALAAGGARVVAYDLLVDRAGGIDRLQGRVRGAGVEFLPLAAVLAEARTVLSTVTTDVAMEAARACVPHLRTGHVYVDLNATSPEAKQAIGRVIDASGAAFVEGAILGAVGVTGAATRVLLCGQQAEPAASALSALGLNVAGYGTEIGRASAFKMMRSVFSKGLEALLLEAMLAARRAGVAEDVWNEIVTTIDEKPFAQVATNWMVTHGTANERRHHEMVQVGELLAALGLDAPMTRATTAFFARSARLGLAGSFSEKPTRADEVLAALERLICPAPAMPSAVKEDP